MQAVKAIGMPVVFIAQQGVEKYRDVCDKNQERLETRGAWLTRPQRVEQIQKQVNVIEGALGFRVQER